MKPLLVATLMGFLALAVTAQAQHLKFNQNGATASLNQSTGPSSSFSLTVSRNTASGTGSSANLSYLEFDFAPDFSSFTFVQITGAIPTSDFTGQSTQHLVLDFNTNQLDPATSIAQKCTFDFTTFTETCGAVTPGFIHVEWHENGVQRSRILALEREDTLGGVTTRVHQRSDNSSANAKGVVFGVPVSPASATVGVNHSATLEVTK